MDLPIRTMVAELCPSISRQLCRFGQLIIAPSLRAGCDSSKNSRYPCLMAISRDSLMNSQFPYLFLSVKYNSSIFFGGGDKIICIFA